MSEENKEFKVVDKRFSAMKDEGETKAGAGFTMKEESKAPAEPMRSPQQLDFSTLIISLATGTLINLGLAPDPATGKTEKHLELAKQNIDILAMLQEKTKGNLTADEAKMLENLLAETRLHFVEQSKK